MPYNFLVVDNEWNQENYPDLIDLVFAVPPSYARVTHTNRPADFDSVFDM
jgi:hypothetical protein